MPSSMVGVNTNTVAGNYLEMWPMDHISKRSSSIETLSATLITSSFIFVDVAGFGLIDDCLSSFCRTRSEDSSYLKRLDIFFFKLQSVLTPTVKITREKCIRRQSSGTNKNRTLAPLT